MANEALANYKQQHPKAVSHIKETICKPSKSNNSSRLFHMSSSPAYSTIEDVVSPTTATTIKELSIAAPLTAAEVETILEQFTDPTHPLDKEELVNPLLTVASELVLDPSVTAWAPTAYLHIPDTTDLSNVEPTRFYLNCAPDNKSCF